MKLFRTQPIEQSPLAQRKVSRIIWINGVLVGVSFFMLFYYVIQHNALAVNVWRTRDAQARLATLSDSRNELVAQQSTLDDRQQLMALAQKAGMVPATAVVYLIEERPVAAR